MNCYKCGIRPAEIKVVSDYGGKPSISYYCRRCYNEIKSSNGDRYSDRCLVCKKGFNELADDWNVGCLNCYETMDRQKLDSLLCSIQNRCYHIGKRIEEATMPLKEVIAILESRYFDAVQKGDTYEAEMLKGQIKGLSDKELDG